MVYRVALGPGHAHSRHNAPIGHSASVRLTSRIPSSDAFPAADWSVADEKVELDDVKWEDIHVTTGALKMFFRELPEPLFTYGSFNDFVDAISKPLPRLSRGWS